MEFYLFQSSEKPCLATTINIPFCSLYFCLSNNIAVWNILFSATPHVLLLGQKKIFSHLPHICRWFAAKRVSLFYKCADPNGCHRVEEKCAFQLINICIWFKILMILVVTKGCLPWKLDRSCFIFFPLCFCAICSITFTVNGAVIRKCLKWVEFMFILQIFTGIDLLASRLFSAGWSYSSSQVWISLKWDKMLLALIFLIASLL